jgi:hypothetical protein
MGCQYDLTQRRRDAEEIIVSHKECEVHKGIRSDVERASQFPNFVSFVPFVVLLFLSQRTLRLCVRCFVRQPSLILCGMVCLLAAWNGCSGGGFESQVSGTVTLDGAPIGPGFLVFVPGSGGRNPANGTIQPDGSYELKTANTSGLHPGKYKVSVTILDQPEVPPGERSYEVAKSRIPTKYNDIISSGLEFEVEPGSNAIDIALSSK